MSTRAHTNVEEGDLGMGFGGLLKEGGGPSEGKGIEGKREQL